MTYDPSGAQALTILGVIFVILLICFILWGGE